MSIRQNHLPANYSQTARPYWFGGGGDADEMRFPRLVYVEADHVARQSAHLVHAAAIAGEELVFSRRKIESQRHLDAPARGEVEPRGDSHPRCQRNVYSPSSPNRHT